MMKAIMRGNYKCCLVKFFLMIIFCCLVAESNGKKQVKALVHLYNSKSKAEAGVDTSPFKASYNVNSESKKNHDPQEDLKEKDKIEKLPGQPLVNFTQYGGYVTVDKTAGRALYYYFAEAQHSKHTLPLLLWLNGGPGCSSLAYGAMQELGPFRVRSDGKTLYKNRYSWNYAANVLFLESPAGVGFSYSNKTSDYDQSGDRTTAEDNYVFLVNWLERFPEYKTRDFYISGESYAGHYVPQLAHTILYHNKQPINSTIIINLKGIIIGNAVMNDETDERGMYDFLASHAIISDDSVEKIKNNNCDFSINASNNNKESHDKCGEANNEIEKDIYYLDIYNIYAPTCQTPNNITARPKMASLLKFDPCSDYYVHAYLNRAEVQEALHANVTNLSYDWEACSDVISDWRDSPSTVLPLLSEFLAKGLRLWIFSGDIDGRVPVTSTKYTLKELKLPVKTQWHPWYLQGEVGGYTQVYEGDLTFATVREAGHQVPSYQPSRALSLIKHFLDGTPLPDTSRYY